MDASGKRSAMEEVEAKSSGGAMPALFVLKATVYVGTAERGIGAHLRITVDSDKPKFQLRISTSACSSAKCNATTRNSNTAAPHGAANSEERHAPSYRQPPLSLAAATTERNPIHDFRPALLHQEDGMNALLNMAEDFGQWLIRTARAWRWERKMKRAWKVARNA